MKKDILNHYPNAICVWRDGARISYEIWDGNKKLSTEHSLTSRGAWKSCLSRIIEKA